MNMLTKEQAKGNLLYLIDQCIVKGGIFKNAMEVASLINSVEVYGADEEPGKPALRAVPSAAEQLQNRIDNSETQS